MSRIFTYGLREEKNMFQFIIESRAPYGLCRVWRVNENTSSVDKMIDEEKETECGRRKDSVRELL